MARSLSVRPQGCLVCLAVPTRVTMRQAIYFYQVARRTGASNPDEDIGPHACDIIGHAQQLPTPGRLSITYVAWTRTKVRAKTVVHLSIQHLIAEPGQRNRGGEPNNAY